jgi:hypothetical protein
MPNGATLTLQYGLVPVGALAAMVKQADISVEDFISYLSESEMSVTYTVLITRTSPTSSPAIGPLLPSCLAASPTALLSKRYGKT